MHGCCLQQRCNAQRHDRLTACASPVEGDVCALTHIEMNLRTPLIDHLTRLVLAHKLYKRSDKKFKTIEANIFRRLDRGL